MDYASAWAPHGCGLPSPGANLWRIRRITRKQGRGRHDCLYCWFWFSEASAAMAAAAVLVLCPSGSLAQPTDSAAQGAGFQSGTSPGGTAAGSPQAEAQETNSAPNVLQPGGAEQRLETDRPSGLERGPLVVVGRDAELKADETAEMVLVIGGSAKVHGKVRETVVVIGGDLEVDGEVGDAVVVVLGNVKARPGARLHQDVVAVMGSIKVDPNVTDP